MSTQIGNYIIIFPMIISVKPLVGIGAELSKLSLACRDMEVCAAENACYVSSCVSVSIHAGCFRVTFIHVSVMQVASHLPHHVLACNLEPGTHIQMCAFVWILWFRFQN